MKTNILALAAYVAVCASASSAMATGGQTYGSGSSIGWGPNGAVLTANTSGGGGVASLYQYFSIVLPANTSFILLPGQTLTLPLTITYSSDAEITPDSQAQASTLLQVNSFEGNDFEFGESCSSDSGDYGCGPTGTVTSAFDFDYAYLSFQSVLQTAPSIELYMQVSASGVDASASLDPVIAFDPNGTNANLFPNGVTITPQAGGAVPEAGAWSLMLLGVGAVGAALRRRRGRVIGAA